MGQRFSIYCEDCNVRTEEEKSGFVVEHVQDQHLNYKEAHTSEIHSLDRYMSDYFLEFFMVHGTHVIVYVPEGHPDWHDEKLWELTDKKPDKFEPKYYKTNATLLLDEINELIKENQSATRYYFNQKFEKLLKRCKLYESPEEE